MVYSSILYEILDVLVEDIDPLKLWVYDSPLPLSWHKWEVNCHNQLQSIGG